MYSLLNDVLFECCWRYSKYLLGLYLALYSCSLLVISLLSLTVYWQLLLIVLLSTCVVRRFFTHILFMSNSSFTAMRKTSKNWFIYTSKMGWQSIQLNPEGCVILPWLIILQFRLVDNKQPQSVLLTIDCMSVDDFRKLKVCLRYGGF